MSIDARALAIVEEVLDAPEKRERLIDALCRGDHALRDRVEAILAAEQQQPALFRTVSFAAPLGLDEALPERVGAYRIVSEIARGGMGMVLKAARDDGLFDQTVAVKLIRRDVSEARTLAHFTAERRVLGRLNHPGVVRILDGGEIDGRPWLAMEFIDGAPITTAIAGAEADRDARLDAFEAICEAVAYAHRMLVVHADIKPSNVLMGVDGRVHLLDFGIARLIDDLDQEPGAEAPYPLTRGYAAPERSSGAPPTVVGDVFSLGMLLVAMLTGEEPDAGAEQGLLPPVPEALGGDLRAIALKALAPEPGARYPDVVTLLADVRRHRRAIPVSARVDEGWRYHAGRFVARHRRGLGLASALGAVLVATSITTTILYLRAEAARTEADARFADARAAANGVVFGLIPKLETLPGALPVRAEAADIGQRYLLRLAGTRQASDAVRIEAATGLLQLAQYQARAGRPNLGQPDKADVNLRRAEAVLQSLAGDDAKLLLARVRLERVRLAAWMQADEPAAVALAAQANESFAAARRLDPHLELEHAMVMADLEAWLGRFPEEARMADRGLLRLAGATGHFDLLDRARLLGNKAEAAYYMGRPADALPLYKQSLDIVAALHAAAPRDPYVRARLSLARWAYGTTLLDLDRVDEAVGVLALAQRDAEAVAAFDPADREAVRMVRVSRNASAQALGLAGRTDAALAQLEAQRKADELAFAAEPSARGARDLVYDRSLIGEMLDSADRGAEACRADRATLALYDGLRRERRMMTLDDANLKLVEQRVRKNCG